MSKQVNRKVKNRPPDSGVVVTFDENAKANLGKLARAFIELARQDLQRKKGKQ